uniref:Suppressor of white apricot N-terminal domain-containing protein n=1 Tax=Ananas comosus var. bracteatus TaxID=296719 RepID=A0A6V7QBM2_ANACO|nr:unnamed protein product [Ananas comosus var. bracteatus]
MDLEVSGRHALLFDNDAAAAFVGSASALVPWSADASLLIDRYDVRHLLDRVPPRPFAAAAAAHRRAEAEIDLERYRDLPPPDDDDGGAYGRFDATAQGAYQSVPFSYGDNDASSDAKRTDPGMENSCYRPPFPVPENLLSNLLAQQYSFKVHVFLLSVVSALKSLMKQWKNTPPSWQQSKDPCGERWDGVICTKSRVTTLFDVFKKLFSMGLEGTLSDDIGKFDQLQTLDLSYNHKLGGPLTPALGNLTQVTHLILFKCSFTGTIPDELGNLRQLTFLALNSNKFIGRIPATLGKLSNLSWLDLADNQLNGTLPMSMNASPGLDQLLNAQHL